MISDFLGMCPDFLGRCMSKNPKSVRKKYIGAWRYPNFSLPCPALLPNTKHLDNQCSKR